MRQIASSYQICSFGKGANKAIEWGQANANPDRGGNTPAVALTGYARSEDRTRALANGFQMQIPKPVEADELIMVVASLAGRLGRLKKPLE